VYDKSFRFISKLYDLVTYRTCLLLILFVLFNDKTTKKEMEKTNRLSRDDATTSNWTLKSNWSTEKLIRTFSLRAVTVLKHVKSDRKNRYLDSSTTSIRRLVDARRGFVRFITINRARA